MESDAMGPHPDEEQVVYRASPDRALRDLKERLRQNTPLRCVEQPDDGEPEVMAPLAVTEPNRAAPVERPEIQTEPPSFRCESFIQRPSMYERREDRAYLGAEDWRDQFIREQLWRDRERVAMARWVFDPETGESHPLPYEARDRVIISHQPSELDSRPPVFLGCGITKYLEKWELHAYRSQWTEGEIIDNFLFNVDPSLSRVIKEARPRDRRWATYKINLYEFFKLEDVKYSIQDLRALTPSEGESVQAFGMRFQKVSDALMTRGKLSDVERCTIFLSKLPRGKRKAVLREMPHDKLEFTALFKLAMKAEADDYKDLLWRGMQREDYSFYKEYGTDRCPDFNDKPWAERRYLMDWDKSHRLGDNDAVIEEMQEKMKEMARQIANFETKVETTYRDKPGSPYSLRWDRRNTNPWRSVEDRNPRTLVDYHARERDEDERRRRDEEDRRRRNEEDRGRRDEEDRRRREEDDRRRREDEERRRRHDNIDRDRWHNLGDVSMFPSMKENVEARRVVPNKGKGVARTQSVRLRLSSDEESPMTPIRVAATKSVRASSSKKADTDYVMAEKDGQRIEGEEVILSPHKRGARKFTMKSTLDDIDIVEPLRRALRQPMQCTILEYLAASRPARDELQMITGKTRIPLNDEVQMATKQEEMPTVAVSSLVAKADRAATVFLDGMEGVPPDKFYILGSGTVQTTLNDEVVLHGVIDNGSEAVIIDEGLSVRLGLDLDRSYQFEIETADGRKQKVAGVCHKAAIEVEVLRVMMPVFAVRDCSAELLLGRTWLSHVHAVTIERPDESQMISIKRPDGGWIMMETVEPRDPRNRAVLAAGGRVPVPLSSRSLSFREKKYGPLLTEEEAAVARERSTLDGVSEEEIARDIKEKKRKEPQRLTEKRIAEMDIGDGNLTEPENERVLEVVKSCDKAIAFSDAERGRIDPRYAKPARIYTIPHTPWNDAGWKFAQKEKEEVISFLKEKMASRVAEPCDSAYANRWFFLRKPNGKIRWIQDLQKVNVVTIQDVGSVPHADLLAEGAAGRSIYSVCDLFSGYDEIPLNPRDRHLTFMHTPLGLVQMLVVPMGWTNGVAVFQRAIVAVLKGFISDKV
ncbi:hypothetical protein CBR_g30165 [Chara braunii]|uniref:Reverse transcriptase domain-containing protein n=1 Tax=Chara braunii TaxID=69332 RepID=A0A388LC67_CHABU|nr:hypothetical protein CBR_g30165 [Chara braunii]|eukprot:GBG79900.1 hypothetical protein CBR_g30165 [Chara braunii]